MKTVFFAAIALSLAVGNLHAAEPESFKVGAFNFTVPEGWTKVQPSSPMRNAQLEIAQGPAKAEVTFFHFGAGASGTPADNVTRWFAQFPGSEQKRDSKNTEINGVRVTFASTEGTFNSGMPGGPTTPLPDHALAGAILQHADGDVYVKMTGPVAIVKSATDAFQKMITRAAESSVQTR
jgi:hypothetical protein